MPQLRTALFIDFDNIYSALRNQSLSAAAAFARDPGKWLHWLERFAQGQAATLPGEVPRKILMRKCYLNPTVFSSFRQNYTRGAFEIVDCPPVTSQGKNSADIKMALDIMDALVHTTRFDEFIILSGDADFLPVLLRLRAHNRRTAVLTNQYAASAYEAAADTVIDVSTFIREGLEVCDEVSDRQAAVPSLDAPLQERHSNSAEATRDEILKRLGLILQDATTARGHLASTELPAIFGQVPELQGHHDWLGFGALRALTKEVVRRHGSLQVVGNNRPWGVNLLERQTVPGLAA